MGIQGLLPQVKSIMVPVHAKDLAGQSVAVDTYSWLHKGALSCSMELCKGLPTSRHIDYCMYRVNLLRHFGVKPILVFDGGFLPMKADQENKRSRTRKENLERAAEHESAGNSAAAYECYQKAVDISPSVAYKLIQALKEEGVDYIVAPYEADAQMAFLTIQKHVDAVITEDSDLIPFGCPRIIYKLDKSGQGVEFRYSLMNQNKDLNFGDFTQQMVLEMCILSGCDYLQSLPGMGIKRAYTLMQKFKSYEKVIKHLKYSAISIPPLYEETFKKAMLTFRHQRVYDPKIEDIVHLSNVSQDVDHDLDFLGPWMPKSTVQGIAKGYIDPFTKLSFEEETVNGECSQNRVYSLQEFKPVNEKKRLDLPVQKNVLTNYFCLASLEAKRKYKAPQINFRQLKVADESLPSNEKSVHLCKKGSLSTNHSKNFFRSGSSNADIPSKFFDKSFSNMELACQENPASSECPPVPQSEHGTTKPFLVAHNKHLSGSLSVMEGNTSSINGIDISKWSYMPNKLVNSREKRTLVQQENADGNFPVCAAPEDFSSGKCYSMLSTRKRKFVHAGRENIEKSSEQETKVKPLEHVETSVGSHEGSYFSTLAHKSFEGNEKPNVLCDISHLNNYSDIAEKSMERFVSVISAFKYVSSGSRASGLRAPLRDAQNVCTARLSAARAED